jgi:glucose-6-phosphate 1-epimerase
MNISELNTRFALEGHLKFVAGKGNLPLAEISNTHANCQVSLYGAHVLSFKPQNTQEVLWLSSQSAFEVGKPIRGGVPVCFPWFGPHPTDSTKPVHGFVRLQTWSIEKTAALPNGDTLLTLSLSDSAQSKAEWPYSFKLEMNITVGKSLDIALKINNTDAQSFSTTNCLHAYFGVKNLANISIDGLKGEYYEPSSADSKTQGSDLLSIEKEENRRYFKHTGKTVIEDPGYGRKTHITKTGSEITVIWNPWKETVKNIGDIADEDYASFVCVEPANAYQNATNIAPGQSHTLSVHISTEAN